MTARSYVVRLGIAVAVVLALAGAFAWQRLQYERLQDRFQAIALRSANEVAALDSTRAVALSQAERIQLLGDSLSAVTRLTVQLRGESDVLDHALKQERVANQVLVARVRELEVEGAPSDAPVAVDSEDVRRARFQVDQAPYHATAAVALPAPPAAGTIDLRVRLDAARLTVRSGCLARNADGVRPARVSIVAPEWLAVVVEKSEQDPEVCNPPPERVRVPWLGGPELVAGLGRTWGSEGAGWGGFAGIGVHARIPFLSR